MPSNLLSCYRLFRMIWINGGLACEMKDVSECGGAWHYTFPKWWCYPHCIRTSVSVIQHYTRPRLSLAGYHNLNVMCGTRKKRQPMPIVQKDCLWPLDMATMSLMGRDFVLSFIILLSCASDRLFCVAYVWLWPVFVWIIFFIKKKLVNI